MKRLAEQHREQLGAVQRQFRQANVKVTHYVCQSFNLQSPLNLQAMTELERRSSSDLLSRGEGKQGLRQRRDKEQMVAEHGAVTQSLQVCHQSRLANISPIYYSTFRQSVDNWRTQWREASWQWESWRGAAPLLMRCVPHTYSFCPS